MSGHAYRAVREHPYRFNDALRGKIAPTPLTVPAFGVHATPYFWLNRDNIDTVLQVPSTSTMTTTANDTWMADSGSNPNGYWTETTRRH